MNVLVLGSSGFLGRLLVDELRGAGHEVEGWSRRAHTPHERRVDLERDAELPPPRDPWDAACLLAGPSVPRRFDADADAASTRRIAVRAFEHVARHAERARVVVASSAHVLAPSPDPIDETTAVAPHGAYGAAKADVEALARASGLDVVVARLFGSLGPRQPRGLFVPDLLERFARGEPRVELAGTDTPRDLTDGRDVARALRLLVEARGDLDPTFHVGTGSPVRPSELAARLAAALGVDARCSFAPGGGPTWIADARRLRARTGWTPRRDLEATVDWIASERPLAPRDVP